ITKLREQADFEPEFSLVAELKGRIVGHLLLSKVQLHRGREMVELLALGPMSVVPSQSHRGIGSELVNSAIRLARDHGYGAIVVAGRPDYYARHGFVPASRWSLRCNIRVPDDALTVLELETGVLDKGGEIRFPPPFAELF
ncbi:MAG TPA: N-acetyltransferase, partial [Gammaproteobacteria bacterium]|nr:N-acetyltransferase [Gammaproteobacteria bacterium]